ncbi:hypothetical protein C4G66_RS24270 [Vibrio parahaemolyticus]|uniref:Uncharacterized protein n=5 Tax=Vibrio parahaemolyticus TaxID=670 RepID=A0AA47JDX6_VIBPH|nr:hypothetical protein [Vibrio parahaemolyticus]EHU4839627.1 hypothetical protein [Vibrio parahaemolyticus]EHU5160877.1 hypothetical protein [Vibrio parahaemolyticus]EIE1275218.1 hypothetical protein [Vibrio parahaemolyticus]EIV1640620.1 hypothetical protein [Vibrio parahaemolyticus]EJC6766183.1 hypothetical protein [Vibrio parahaemolyticus]
MIARAVVLTTNICSELELKAHVPFAWRFFTNKKRLIKYYKSALKTLLTSRKDELKFYAHQKSFSHMTLSVAFWHYDLHWNVWSKEGMDFERHPNCSPNPFIILSDFEVGNSNISRLRDIFEGWEVLGSLDESDDDDKTEFFINLAHEALAVAIQSRTIKPLFLEIFAENSNIDDALFNERVRVRDEDGHFDINFLDLIQQRS